jgi:epoxide hydrolase 4
MVGHEYVEVNGVRLHVALAGRREAPLMLFLHGFPDFWYEWRRQLEHFEGDFLAVAPDLRGYNLSDKPSELDAYRIKPLLDDVKALAARFGRERFVLVGHDWGGAVAWAFAIAYPNMLEKLVIVNAPHPGVFQRELRENPAQAKASQYMLLFRSGEAERVLSAGNCAWLQRAFDFDRWSATPEERQMYLDAWSQPGALTGGLNYYRANHAGPPLPGEPEPAPRDPAQFMVRVPTLVIWGERDTALLTGNLDGLDRFVPDLRIERVPDATHWVVHEKPYLVNRLIHHFVGARSAP